MKNIADLKKLAQNKHIRLLAIIFIIGITLMLGFKDNDRIVQTMRSGFVIFCPI